MRLGRDNATADIEHRALGPRDQIEHFSQLIVARFRLRRFDFVAGQVDSRRKGRCEDGLLHILRDVDHDGARAASRGDVKSLFDHAREVLFVEDKETVLYDRQRHAEEVGLLKRGFSDKLLVNLPRDRNQRDAVHKGIGNTGHKIRRAGARSSHTDTGLTRGTGVSVCHETTALLKAGQDGADLCALSQGLMQLH